MNSLQLGLRLFAISLALSTAGPGWGAQPYPARGLRLVVPFAPGGSTDVLSRIVAQPLAESFGQPVVVDNRPAGGGVVASELVARATADGYTLLVGSVATMVIARALHARLPYEPMRDFEHIGLWVTFPLALVVPAASPARTLKELLDEARAKPDTLRHGLQGIGTSSHAFNELMCHMAGVRVVNVPYKGGAPALTAVLTGEVNYAMVAVSTAQTQLGSGRIRVLGVTSPRPAPSLPNVPPIAAVLPGYEALNFHGLQAPAKTPRAVIAKLNEETTRILRRRDVAEKLAGMSMEVPASTPAEYGAFIRAQIAKWTPLVKASGVSAN